MVRCSNLCCMLKILGKLANDFSTLLKISPMDCLRKAFAKSDQSNILMIEHVRHSMRLLGIHGTPPIVSALCIPLNLTANQKRGL